MMDHRLTSKGVKGRLSGAEMSARMRDSIDNGPPDGRHQWAILVQYRVDDSTAASIHEGVEAELDVDKVVFYSPVVCMRCEHAFDAVVTYRCPGDPGRYAKDGRPHWRVGGVWTPNPWPHLDGDEELTDD